MRSLAIRLPPGPREVPLDYASRLACANGRDGVRALCTDFGIGVHDLARGGADAVRTVAALGRADAGTLARNSLEPTPGGRVAHRGCEFHKAMVSRRRIRFCPACIELDLQAGTGRPEARMWRRGEWLLRDVRTCHVHDMVLAELDAQADPRVPDFSRALSSAGVARGAPPPFGPGARPNGLERHILRRLDVPGSGSVAVPALDDLPLHACIRLAEVVGAVALDGPRAPMHGIDDARLRERQGVGFDLAALGADGVRQLMDRLLAGMGRGGQRGPQAVLGRLYLWLAHPSCDASLAPFRDHVREACLERLAIGPEDPIAPFGVPVAGRRLHSVRSASVEFRVHPSTLRNILTSRGIVAAGPLLSDDLTTFDAAAHAGLLGDMADALDLRRAARRLGVSPSTLEELVRAGLVVPFLGGLDSAFRHYRFRPVDIDAFVESLAPPRNGPTQRRSGSLPLPDAARRARCSIATVVGLLVAGRLPTAARTAGAEGLVSVLVSPSEIRWALAPPSPDMVHPREVRQATGLALHVVRALARAGHLKGTRLPDPATGAPRLMVTRASLASFRDDHVSLAELASAASIPPGRAWAAMSAAGVAPAFDHRLLGAAIYRRADLADAPLRLRPAPLPTDGPVPDAPPGAVTEPKPESPIGGRQRRTVDSSGKEKP